MSYPFEEHQVFEEEILQLKTLTRTHVGFYSLISGICELPPGRIKKKFKHASLIKFKFSCKPQSKEKVVIKWDYYFV